MARSWNWLFFKEDVLPLILTLLPVIFVGSFVWSEFTIKVGSVDKLEDHQMPKEALRGKLILEDTYRQVPEFVGAKLNCTNCHMNGGTTLNAGPWLGIVHRFPQYRDRSGKEDTLVDRINDCFERSLNGKRVPEDSETMRNILAYMEYLSRDVKKGQKIEGIGMPKLVLKREPDMKNGERVYLAKCASCHQNDGQGLYQADGKVVFPALWGAKSFNIGAGMARHHTAAGFVKANMPLGQPNSLTDDEAWDVAWYFTRKERPDFARKHLDWPKGNKPADARY
ncbi:MAG: c-type cytochrome [Bdellovibrionaceae bacterium]|nr:c-type cytochrome [Pseudobdellovibrionaceae bacterium]